LVLIILAAIAVDSAVAFLGQRQLGDAVAAAANDAAAAALSDENFYDRGQISIDPRQAATVVCESMAAQQPNLQDIRVSIAVAGTVIAVRATAEVEEVFGRALPGLHQRQVSASASAQAENGPVASASAPVNFVPTGC
jgi:Flp pilus assembly protein TadG